MAGVQFNEWLLRPLWFIVAEYCEVPPIPGAFRGLCRTFPMDSDVRPDEEDDKHESSVEIAQHTAQHEEDDKHESSVEIAQHTVCWLVLCAHNGCAGRVCVEHGWGHDPMRESDARDCKHKTCGKGDCDKRECKHDKCNKHYCEDHYEADTSRCDVCTYERRDGISEWYGEDRFCAEHEPTQCVRLIDEGDRAGEACGFWCCRHCINDHFCDDTLSCHL
jgi:hypothetical protein